MVVFILQACNTSELLFAKKHLTRLVVRQKVQDGQETHYKSGHIMRLSPVFMNDEQNDAQQNEKFVFSQSHPDVSYV